MPTTEVAEPTAACCWLLCTHSWWSMPADAGAARPNRAAAKPVATMLANPNFFILLFLFLVSECVRAVARESRFGRWFNRLWCFSLRYDCFNAHVSDVIPLAVIDRRLAGSDGDPARDWPGLVTHASQSGRGGGPEGKRDDRQPVEDDESASTASRRHP